MDEEILRGREREPDAACRWVERTKPAAERRADFDVVRRLLKVAPDLLDPDIPHDQADPYVIALALAMRTEELTFDMIDGGIEVTIVTEDRKDKPSKLSLTTAAGMVGVPVVPLFALVRIGGISP
jgi:hypothetical protein